MEVKARQQKGKWMSMRKFWQQQREQKKKEGGRGNEKSFWPISAACVMAWHNLCNTFHLFVMKWNTALYPLIVYFVACRTVKEYLGSLFI